LLGGHRLRSQDIALVGSLGIDHLDVRQKLRIGLFSTGDELCEPGQMRDRGQIWDANRLLLLGLLDTASSEVKDYGIVRDDPAEVEGHLLAAARDCDLLITTGGMSVGREDHVRNIIGRRGVLDVWPVAIKPGRPVGFGDIDDCPILALPGNPTAAFIAFVAFGRPIVDALCGVIGPFTSPLHLPAGFSFEKPRGLRQYLLAGIAAERFGMSTAIPWHKQSPAMLSPLTKAAGVIVLPEERERVRFGELVEFLPIETFIE
jgi:molybdopterin molybdotransferase